MSSLMVKRYCGRIGTFLNALFNNFGSSVFKFLFLFLVYSIVSLFVLNTFMTHFGFRGKGNRFSFDRLVEYKFEKPYVYRILTPLVVNGIRESLPAGLRNAVVNSPHFVQHLKDFKKRFNLIDQYILEQASAYVLLFITLLLIQFLLRHLSAFAFRCCHPVFVDFLPAISLIFLPFSFRYGGYLYDFPALFFSSLCLFLAIREKYAYYYIALFLALLNKETSFLYGVFFFVLNLGRSNKRFIIKHVLFHLTLASLVLVSVRIIFQNNAGSGMEFWLEENIKFYLNPATYFSFGTIYSELILFPKDFNILLIGLFSFLVFYKFNERPIRFRQLFLLMITISLPLMIIWGYKAEYRAILDLVFPVMYLLAFQTVVTLFGERKKDEFPEERNKTIKLY